MKQPMIVVFPGDGIGPEVTAEAMAVPSAFPGTEGTTTAKKTMMTDTQERAMTSS